MQNVLDDIPTEFALDEYANTDYENYLQTFEIAADIQENSKVPGSLTGQQLEDLEAIMQSGYVTNKAMALAILKWNDPDYFYNEVILDPVQGMPRRSAQTSDQKMQEPVMTVFPNPAWDYFTIQYRTESQPVNNLQLVIQDAEGRKIMVKQLKEINNDELIDIRTLVPGIYSVILYGDNNVLSVYKLVVVK